jgi:diaminopropionate ammonia-lyase
LNENADAFIIVPDYIAAKGMRMYATPLNGDPSSSAVRVER